MDRKREKVLICGTDLGRWSITTLTLLERDTLECGGDSIKPQCRVKTGNKSLVLLHVGIVLGDLHPVTSCCC